MENHQFGTLSKTPEGFQVVFERIYHHPQMIVWDAITNPDKMKMWFMEVFLDKGLNVGSRMTIRFPDGTDSFGRIMRVETGKLFEYVWENEDGPDELATWEIFPQGDKRCKLVMTYCRTFDQYATSVPAGWHMMLSNLEAVLDHRPSPFPDTEHESPQREELKRIYADNVNTLRSSSEGITG